jgi:hypothetical protein
MSLPYPDEICMARHCREARQATTVEFCRHHERQLQVFRQWLDGLDGEGCPIVRSFDFERGTWSEPRPSA